MKKTGESAVWVNMFESMLFPLLHVSFIKFSFCTPSYYPFLWALTLSLALILSSRQFHIFLLLFFFLSFRLLGGMTFSDYTLCLSAALRFLILAAARSTFPSSKQRKDLNFVAVAARVQIRRWLFSFMYLCVCFSEKSKQFPSPTTMWLWLRALDWIQKVVCIYYWCY